LSATNNVSVTVHSSVATINSMIDAVRPYEGGKFRKSDSVTIKRDVRADVFMGVRHSRCYAESQIVEQFNSHNINLWTVWEGDCKRIAKIRFQW